MPKFTFDGHTVSLPVSAQRRFEGLAETIAAAAKIDSRFAALAEAMAKAMPLICPPADSRKAK